MAQSPINLLEKLKAGLEKLTKEEREALQLKDCRNCSFHQNGYCTHAHPPTKILNYHQAQICETYSPETITTGAMSKTERETYASILDRIKTIDLVKLITKISEITTITTLQTLSEVTNIKNIENVDLIDIIALISTVSEVTNIANIQSVDLIDAITTIGTIDKVTEITEIKGLTKSIPSNTIVVRDSGIIQAKQSKTIYDNFEKTVRFSLEVKLNEKADVQLRICAYDSGGNLHEETVLVVFDYTGNPHFITPESIELYGSQIFANFEYDTTNDKYMIISMKPLFYIHGCQIKLYNDHATANYVWGTVSIIEEYQ